MHHGRRRWRRCWRSARGWTNAPGVAEVAFCFGFPYADFADCGVALAAYAETQAQADAAVDAFEGRHRRARGDVRREVVPAEEAVPRRSRWQDGATKPIVIADTQDNPGAGGHGDTTGMLAELIAQKAEGAVLALINDDESAAACHAAGEGATVALSLGGKSDGVPIAVRPVC